MHPILLLVTIQPRDPRTIQTDSSVNLLNGLKWIPYSVGVVTVRKLSETTAKKKQLYLATEYRSEGSPEIKKIKKILDAQASTSSSIIKENLSKTINQAVIKRACKSPDACSMPVKFNLALPATAPMAVYEMYTKYEEVEHTTVDPTTVDYTTYPIEKAEEKRASIVSALENLNAGEGPTLIENFASISANELE